MAYANPFNATIMPGTTQAKLIDDFSRQGYAALIERLNDKMLVDATADPWVLKAEVSGAKDGKVLIIPFIEFVTLGGGNTTISEDKITCLPAANALVAPVQLPNGVTVKKVEILVSNGNPSLSWAFYRVAGTPPFARTDIAADTYTTSGLGVITSAVLSEVTNGTNMYYISIDTTSSAGVAAYAIYGARVTYNTPNHLATI